MYSIEIHETALHEIKELPFILRRQMTREIDALAMSAEGDRSACMTPGMDLFNYRLKWNGKDRGIGTLNAEAVYIFGVNGNVVILAFRTVSECVEKYLNFTYLGRAAGALSGSAQRKHRLIPWKLARKNIFSDVKMKSKAAEESRLQAPEALRDNRSVTRSGAVLSEEDIDRLLAADIGVIKRLAATGRYICKRISTDSDRAGKIEEARVN